MSHAPIRNLGAILILFSLSLTMSPVSRASASCAFVTCAVSDPCSTSKLLPPLLPKIPTLSSITAIPSFPTSNPPKYTVRSLFKIHFHHPANPLYPNLFLSNLLSTSSHYSSQVLQPLHINHCTTSLERYAA